MKKFPVLFRTLAVLALIGFAFSLGLITCPHAIAFAIGWQMIEFSLSKQTVRLFTATVLTPEQIKEFEGILQEIRVVGRKSKRSLDWLKPFKVKTMPTRLS